MASLIRSRELSPVELVEAHLRQIEKHNPEINAFVSIHAEEARAAAKQAEAAVLSGQHLGRLHGVPLTVKDSFDLEGRPTYCGSRFRLDHVATADSGAARRMKEEGGVILGKTNCPEFLMNYETDNRITGRTNNPWNLERTPGGSSGGESAAIASFCSAGGIGSDGGGSVRIPAHFSGICALKPTPGRVSAAGHFPEICHPGGLLGVAGPMARTAGDLRLLFEVFSKYDPDDPFAAPVPLRTADLSGVRVGLMEQFYEVPVQPPIRAAVRKVAKVVENLGIPIEPFSPRGLERAPNIWWFFFGQLSAPLLRALVEGQEDQAHWTGTEFLRQAEKEEKPTVLDVLENLATRDRLRASVMRQMERIPLLLLPACGVVAFPHRQRRWETGEKEIGLFEAMMPATPFNLLGFPAMVIPFDLTEDGLPVGVQIVGRPYEEELILELAVKLEEARGPFPAPKGFTD